MAGACQATPEQKASMKGRGVWTAFLALKAELKKEGHTATSRHRVALATHCPPELLEAEKAARDALSGPVTGPPAVVPDSSDSVPLDALRGKRPRPGEVISWVANNQHGAPDMGSCPGMEAFSLLQQCKSSPAFRDDFWKSMWTKTIPRTLAASDEGEEKFDGKVTRDFLEKIIGIRERSEGRE